MAGGPVSQPSREVSDVTRRTTSPSFRTLRLARRAGCATVIASLAVLGSSQAVAAAATGDPVGYLDLAVPSGSTGITVQGWAADPDDLTLPLTVQTSLDGAPAGQVLTAVSRPDVVNAIGTGPTPGFAMTLAAAPGSHTVCVTAVNVAAGGDPAPPPVSAGPGAPPRAARAGGAPAATVAAGGGTSRGCGQVTVPPPVSSTPTGGEIAAHSPIGALEKVSANGNTVTLT